MKKKLVAVIFMVFFSISNAFAYCYYVSCSSSVMVAVMITITNMEQQFMKINFKINDIESAYSDYSDVLEENNRLYDKNSLLKQEYLLILQEISQKQQLLKNVKGIGNE
jgi:hypothetical protein